MKTKSLILGFFVGGISAGIATLLSAPASGKDTRKYVKENTDVLKLQLSDLKSHIGDLTQSITNLSKEGKEAITAFVTDIKILIEDWKTEITPHQEQLKKELHDLQESLKELEAKLEPIAKEQ